MSARRLTTRRGDRPEAIARRRIAQKYLEVAELLATEDGEAINVSVGLAVLAGIAAADAICLVAIGERYAGSDHAAAADLLARVDNEMGKRLREVVGLKPGSHYGTSLLSVTNRTTALRAARALVDNAAQRTT